MARVSKLTIIQLEEMKSDLGDPRVSQQFIATKFRITTATVWYYKKKFAPTVERLYGLPPAAPARPKPRCYEDYLREYYHRIGKPFQKPMRPKTDWIPYGPTPRDLWQRV